MSQPNIATGNLSSMFKSREKKFSSDRLDWFFPPGFPARRFFTLEDTGVNPEAILRACLWVCTGHAICSSYALAITSSIFGGRCLTLRYEKTWSMKRVMMGLTEQP